MDPRLVPRAAGTGGPPRTIPQQMVRNAERQIVKTFTSALRRRDVVPRAVESGDLVEVAYGGDGEGRLCCQRRAYRS